jgi:uncharacterized protein YceK
MKKPRKSGLNTSAVTVLLALVVVALAGCLSACGSTASTTATTPSGQPSATASTSDDPVVDAAFAKLTEMDVAVHGAIAAFSDNDEPAWSGDMHKALSCENAAVKLLSETGDSPPHRRGVAVPTVSGLQLLVCPTEGP